MRHTRFLSSNDTVCMKPERLGSDFLVTVNDYDFDDPEGDCKTCMALLFAHNERENHNDWGYGITYVEEEQSRPAWHLAALIFVLIVAISFIVWMVFFYGL